MYFVWKSDFDNDRFYTRASIVNAKALVGLKLVAGQSLVGLLPVIDLEIESDCEVADYFNAGPLFVVSEKLRKVLDDANASVEYHSVNLLKKGKRIDGVKYYFANLLEKIDCFDFEKSTYTVDDGFIDKIERLVIDESKVNQKTLFRLDRSYDVIIFASSNLRDAIETRKISGVKFYAPADWRW